MKNKKKNILPMTTFTMHARRTFSNLPYVREVWTAVRISNCGGENEISYSIIIFYTSPEGKNTNFTGCGKDIQTAIQDAQKQYSAIFQLMVDDQPHEEEKFVVE